MNEISNTNGLGQINSNTQKFNELVQKKKIIEYGITDTKYSLPHGGLNVDLPDGEKGIVVAIVQPYYYVEDSMAKTGQARKLKILRLDGTEYMDLTEPELGANPSSQVKIARDEEALYVTTYNTKDSYLARYQMGTFNREWKNQLGFQSMQSITVNDTNIIGFNMTDGTIDYFNKQTGEKEKSVDVKEQWGHSHHNLAASDIMLLAGAPGSNWIIDIPKQLKTFDSEGNMVAQKDIPTDVGILNAVSVDSTLQRIYLAFDDKIAMFTPQGYSGTMQVPCGRIMELNVDTDTSALIVSSSNPERDTGGKLDIIQLEEMRYLGIGVSEKSQVIGQIKSPLTEREETLTGLEQEAAKIIEAEKLVTELEPDNPEVEE